MYVCVEFSGAAPLFLRNYNGVLKLKMFQKNLSSPVPVRDIVEKYVSTFQKKLMLRPCNNDLREIDTD